MEFLRVKAGRITDNGRPVHLKGVNLGGWLMPEAYFTQAVNRGYRFFKADFIKALGLKTFCQLETAFRDNFIVEDDLKRIAELGFDHVRLPFHYALIEGAAGRPGWRYLDQAVAWAGKNGLRVILDMHAVPGAQNHDWHSDSDGRAQFWQVKKYQQRAAALWQLLAAHFQHEPAVIGYDILNEAVLEDAALLNAYYQSVIKVIREVDRAHIIFVEGNRWAQDISCLDDFADDNLVLGIHFYELLEFTCNMIPGIRYPQGEWDKAFMKKRLAGAFRIARERGRALWCGEFGVNNRDGFYGEDKWVRDITGHFKDMEIHWSYWTWKAVRNHLFPDGIYSYLPNPAWVNRQGPVSGWDTWHRHWLKNKKEMVASWRTEAFTPNPAIIKALWKK